MTFATFDEYETWSLALDERLTGGWESRMMQQAIGICGSPPDVRSRVEQLMLEGAGMELDAALTHIVHELAFGTVTSANN